MDENEFKQSYRNIINTKCAFEKSLLAKQCQCTLSESYLLAEREGINCKLKSAQLRCLDILDHLRKNATFVLKISKIGGVLPHAKEMKVQCGGIQGLCHALKSFPCDLTIDVYDIIEKAVAKYTTLNNFPYQQIVLSISSFQKPARRKKRKE